MTDELRIDERPNLERPVLIAAFRGWNDGGQGASLAGAYLAQAWAAEQFAEIEPENFYDFQATRPMVSLVDGETRQIDWPENTFLHAPLPGGGRDAILLLGVEPNLRWRTFSDARRRARARRSSVELVITLGSLLADVPHTRAGARHGQRDRPGADRVSSACRRRATRARPASSACSTTPARRAGLKSASLWAAVPHYVSLTPVAACRQGARRPARGAARAPTSTPPSSTRRPRRTRSRSARPSPRDAETVGVRRGARAPGRRARRRGGPPLGRLDRRRADPLPPRT